MIQFLREDCVAGPEGRGAPSIAPLPKRPWCVSAPLPLTLHDSTLLCTIWFTQWITVHHQRRQCGAIHPHRRLLPLRRCFAEYRTYTKANAHSAKHGTTTNPLSKPQHKSSRTGIFECEVGLSTVTGHRNPLGSPTPWHNGHLRILNLEQWTHTPAHPWPPPNNWAAAGARQAPAGGTASR